MTTPHPIDPDLIVLDDGTIPQAPAAFPPPACTRCPRHCPDLDGAGLLGEAERLAEALPEGHQDVLDVLGHVDVRLSAQLVSDLFHALKKARGQ